MTIKLTDLFERIRDAIRECGPSINLHDQALVAITMCIGAGIDTKPGLIRVLKTYGFTAGHIAHVLNNRTGPFRNSSHWTVDADGRYHLVDQAA